MSPSASTAVVMVPGQAPLVGSARVNPIGAVDVYVTVLPGFQPDCVAENWKRGIDGRSQVASGIWINTLPPPAIAFNPVGGNTEPHACDVAIRLLPLAVNVVLAQTCTWPVPPEVPSVFGQVTFMMMCSAWVKLVSAGQPPAVPPVPVAPPAPVVPVIPPAPV